MAIRLFSVACLAALVVFPAHSQNLSELDHAVAITTLLQFITEDDVEQRTKLDLLLAQKQASREEVIAEVGIDLDRIVKAEGAGLLSDALVDQAFADMCSRLNVAPAGLMKSLEEKGIRLDTLKNALRLMLLGNVWRKGKVTIMKIASITLSFPKCEQEAP